MKHMFCFGFGLSAKTLAPRLVNKGWKVSGTSRSMEGAEAITRAGFQGNVFDGTQPLSPHHLDGVTHLLISAPPSDRGDPVLSVMGEEIARRAKQFEWVGYLSTTGVYGDAGGDWVSEESPLQPAGVRGQRRVDAEAAWREINGLCVMSFRLAGIYGPGRNAFESIRNGKARRIVKPGQVFSRIHVEDIAGVLEASIAKPNCGQAYNVCDDEPCPPQDVISWACEYLGVEAPPLEDFAKAQLSSMAASFYGESKRVSNQRIKDELGYQLIYPNYREGLKALGSSRAD